jgi:hypothetical protein
MSIGELPTSLEIDGVNYSIRTHFKNALLCFDAFNNPKLSEIEKQIIVLKVIYKDKIPPNNVKALEKAAWFLDYGDTPKPKQMPYKIFDWKHDESLIFSAVNIVAGKETRLPNTYIHWWTFLGYFQEIPPESMYSQVLRIRKLKAEGGKGMTKEDKKFLEVNKDIIDIKETNIDNEEELAFINSLI